MLAEIGHRDCGVCSGEQRGGMRMEEEGYLGHQTEGKGGSSLASLMTLNPHLTTASQSLLEIIQT